MDLEIRSVDSSESDDSPLIERFLLGLVRLASWPLFLLAIVLASLIYGIAILSRSLVILIAFGFRLVRTPPRVGNPPSTPQPLDPGFRIASMTRAGSR
jgi:hypothetical protein